MTREEAIRLLKTYRNCLFGILTEPIAMAIKALEQEPCEDATLKDIFCMGCEYKEPTTKNDLGVDAVSRQSVLDIIRFEDKWLLDVKGHNTNTKIAFSGMKSEIAELPPVNPQEPKTGEWIPISERLPENIRPVIVTWKNNNPESYYQHIVGKHFIGVAHYLKGKWYWYSSTTEDFLAEYGRYEGEEFDEAIEVIAWQPLPEPYKAESEGEK